MKKRLFMNFVLGLTVCISSDGYSQSDSDRSQMVKETDEILRLAIVRFRTDVISSSFDEVLQKVAFYAPLPMDIEICREKNDRGPAYPHKDLKLKAGFFTTQQLLQSVASYRPELVKWNSDANGVLVKVGSLSNDQNILDVVVHNGGRIRGDLSDVLNWLRANVDGFQAMYAFYGMEGSSQALDFVITEGMSVRSILTTACRLSQTRWTADVFAQRDTFQLKDAKGEAMGPVRQGPRVRLSFYKHIIRKSDVIMDIADFEKSDDDRSSHRRLK